MTDETTPLSDMTKAELVAVAKEVEADFSTADNKATIVAAIEAAELSAERGVVDEAIAEEVVSPADEDAGLDEPAFNCECADGCTCEECPACASVATAETVEVEGLGEVELALELTDAELDDAALEAALAVADAEDEVKGLEDYVFDPEDDFDFESFDFEGYHNGFNAGLDAALAVMDCERDVQFQGKCNAIEKLRLPSGIVTVDAAVEPDK